MTPPSTVLEPQGAMKNKEALDVARIRNDFPILQRRIRGKKLVYLDNAASTQKCTQTIAAIRKAYEQEYANVHRGVHTLSQLATEAYEGARAKATEFIGAGETREIVYVRGTTEGINLVASSFVRPRISEGDEILITHMEHHSNIVPWQMLCQEKGCKLVVVPIDDSGEMIESEFDRLLTDKTKFVSVGHVSNALGSINPVKEIVRKSHERGVPVMIDGAQATPHMPVDVQDIGCDFYAFSGHKVYGPTGIGILYGKAEHLEAMPPYQGGGDMISSVSFNGTTYNEIPYKFEAGTPNIAGAIGLGAALDYLSSLGLDRIAAHEKEVLDYGTKRLTEIPGLRLIGTSRNKAGVLSFVMEDIHPNDIGTLLDQKGIAVRTGQHCAEPVMDRFGIHSTVRASLGLYNSKEDIDSLVDGLESVRRIFA